MFLDDTWLHLGDSGHDSDRVLSFKEKMVSYSPSQIIRIFWNRLGSGFTRGGQPQSDIHFCKPANFKEFNYLKGDVLPFEDSSFTYIYSEHFFEHLFLDEAVALMGECYRILQPWGVMRTCVPDADLRVYEPPEPIGYPKLTMPFGHPMKHKTRWSVYSLDEALRFSGFKPLPLRYCDRSGKYLRMHPLETRESYGNCPDTEMVFDLTYVMRLDSLIVDGVKITDEAHD